MELSAHSHYRNLPLFHDDYKMIQKTPQVPANAGNLLMSLQDTIVKQQVLLKYLFEQQQQQPQKIEKYEEKVPEIPSRDAGNSIIIRRKESIPQERLVLPSLPSTYKLHRLLETPKENILIKQDYIEDRIREEERYAKSLLGANIIVRRKTSMETDTSMEDSFHKSLTSSEGFSQGLYIAREISRTQSEEGDFESRNPLPMLRRNGFKSEIKLPSSDEDEETSCEGYQRKSNKLIIPKRPPSKAKHLWINYGRKIIEFAINNTKDEVQSKVKQLIGKLSSKKDFEDVFGVREQDTDYEKTFKILLGKMAIYFVKMQSEAAFEGSKYKEQMVTQKNVVASLISRLISGQM